MKLPNWIFVFCLICILLISLSHYTSYHVENFTPSKPVDFYIITMKSEDRMKNINEQLEKLRTQNVDTNRVELVDAVVGKNLDLDKMVQEKKVDFSGKNFTTYGSAEETAHIRKREIGCYMSHMKTYDLISSRNNTKGDGYSVIFEDDFTVTDDFAETLHKTIDTVSNIDFDVLFLGIRGAPGKQVVNNIYEIGASEGAHGYLVNNSKIDKIKKELQTMDNVVDYNIFNKGHSKELIVYRIEPLIVGHDQQLPSGIQVPA